MRVVNDAAIQTRTARQRLQIRHKPYFRAIESGVHLGYRKGEIVGTWLARVLVAGRYVTKRLGTADDRPDMADALDYATAAQKARAWCTEQQKAAKAGETPARSGPYLVRHAVADYLEDYKGRGGRGLRTVEAALNTHVLPALGAIALDDLTTRRLRQWHQGIAQSAPRLRTGKLATKVNKRAVPATPEQIRARRSTANHIRTTFFAALNFAFHEGKVESDQVWRRVKPFKAVDAPRIRYLTPDEAKRLVNACEGHFRDIVRAALLTGCRYGELGALLASDFNADVGMLLIRHGKGGKPRHVVLTDEAKTFFADMTAGRAHDALIFTTVDGSPWTPSLQHRPLKAACTAAKIVPAIGFHILRHTHGSLLAMAGAPLAVISKQLGHADSRITEKHYAHLAPDYVADTIRASMPTLGIVAATNVAPIGRRRGKQ